jgi:hypothetical protein
MKVNESAALAFLSAFPSAVFVGDPAAFGFEPGNEVGLCARSEPVQTKPIHAVIIVASAIQRIFLLTARLFLAMILTTLPFSGRLCRSSSDALFLALEYP